MEASYLQNEKKFIQVIATDIDGTLLNDQHEISRENFNAICEAQAAGKHVLVATGRSIIAAKQFLAKWEISCGLICANGAIVTDEDGNLIHKGTISREEMHKVVSLMAENNFYIEIYTNKGNFTKDFRKQPHQDRLVEILMNAHRKDSTEDVLKYMYTSLANGQLLVVDEYNDVLDDEQLEFYKIFGINGLKEEMDFVWKALEQNDAIGITTSWTDNIEINAAGTSKGNALTTYTQKFGYKIEETMAIGDSDNDLSMLEIAGLSVAMGNATDKIKACCDVMTTSNDENGVAEAIRRYVL